MRLDIAGREAARIESEDLVVEALEPALPLPDQLRLEAAVAIPGRLDPHRPVLGRKRLRSRAVARVADPARWLPVRLVAEMLGKLRRQGTLHQPLRQPGEHPARPDDLLLGPRTGEQLVDHLIGEPITHPARQPPEQHALPRARSADGSLRSPPAPSSAAVVSISFSVLVSVDMTLLFGHAYTGRRTLPGWATGAGRRGRRRSFSAKNGSVRRESGRRCTATTSTYATAAQTRAITAEPSPAAARETAASASGRTSPRRRRSSRGSSRASGG